MERSFTKTTDGHYVIKYKYNNVVEEMDDMCGVIEVDEFRERKQEWS